MCMHLTTMCKVPLHPPESVSPVPDALRYLLDTDAEGRPLEHQVVTLQYLLGGGVATEDEPPVVLGQLPASFVEQMARHLRPGRLLRFSLGDVSPRH